MATHRVLNHMHFQGIANTLRAAGEYGASNWFLFEAVKQAKNHWDKKDSYVGLSANCRAMDDW